MGRYNTKQYHSEYDAGQHFHWQSKIKLTYDNLNKINKNFEDTDQSIQHFIELLHDEIYACRKSLDTIEMNALHFANDTYAEKLQKYSKRYQVIYGELSLISKVHHQAYSLLGDMRTEFNKKSHLKTLKSLDNQLRQFHFDKNDPNANEHASFVVTLQSFFEQVQDLIKNHNHFLMESELNLHAAHQKLLRLREQCKVLNRDLFYSEDNQASSS